MLTSGFIESYVASSGDGQRLYTWVRSSAGFTVYSVIRGVCVICIAEDANATYFLYCVVHPIQSSGKCTTNDMSWIG